MAKNKIAYPHAPSWEKQAWWWVPLLAILVYIPSFTADFTLDDVLIVEQNEYVKSLRKIPDIWTSHYWAGKADATDTGLYRPLTLTTYNVQFAIHGPHPALYHILNILLHALVCFVLMKTSLLLFSDTTLTVISGLFFAIHPLHTEAVAGIVGRAEMLVALFILTSMISYHHWRNLGKPVWLVALVVSCLAGITSKEHGFMIPAILILQEMLYALATKKKTTAGLRPWVATGIAALIAILLWIYRSSITGPSVPHELWAGIAPPERMATSIRTMAEYAGMHLWPIPLSADYGLNEVPIAGFGHLEVLVSFAFFLVLIVAGFHLRKKNPPFTWGILFFLLTLIPVSNFFFAAGFLKAERILYIPSIGLITALAALASEGIVSRKMKLPVYIFLGIMVLFFAGKTWIRSGEWQNNFTLSKATLRTSPNSPRFNNMMGLELRKLKQNEQALRYFEKAVQSNPKHVPALVNLGTEYRHFGRLPEAAATLERALALEPNSLATYVNLMSVYRSLGDFNRNVQVAELALQRFPQSAAILWNAANAWHLKGDMERANTLRAKARQIDPKIGTGN